MDYSKKTMLLYTKFSCLQIVLNDCKEGYCGKGKPDDVSEIDYIKVGNMLKQLTKIEVELDKQFDYLNEEILDDLDEKLMEQIFNNVMERYGGKHERSFFDMLFEDFNLITRQVGLLRGLTTTSYIYDSISQEVTIK